MSSVLVLVLIENPSSIRRVRRRISLRKASSTNTGNPIAARHKAGKRSMSTTGMPHLKRRAEVQTVIPHWADVLSEGVSLLQQRSGLSFFALLCAELQLI